MDWGRPRKYEFSLVIGLVGVLAALLLGALSRLQDEMEDATMQAEVAALRADLLEWVAHREISGGNLPASRNPLAWLTRRPLAYAGELTTAPAMGGVWYFDRQREELVYRFRAGGEARYRLVLRAESAEAPGRLGGIGLWRVDSGGKL